MLNKCLFVSTSAKIIGYSPYHPIASSRPLAFALRHLSILSILSIPAFSRQAINPINPINPCLQQASPQSPLPSPLAHSPTLLNLLNLLNQPYLLLAFFIC